MSDSLPEMELLRRISNDIFTLYNCKQLAIRLKIDDDEVTAQQENTRNQHEIALHVLKQWRRTPSATGRTLYKALKTKSLKHLAKKYKQDLCQAGVCQPDSRRESIVEVGLPVEMIDSYFCGRDKELAILVEEIQTGKHRVTTLVGPPCFGKTTLATAVAHHLQTHHGMSVHFLDLRQNTSIKSILHALCCSFDTTNEQLNEQLASLAHPTLVVLDNAEDCLLEESEPSAESNHKKLAQLLQMLVTSSDKVCVLITSRVEFKRALPNMQPKQYNVDGISSSSAVALLQKLCHDNHVPITLDIATSLVYWCGNAPFVVRLVLTILQNSNLNPEELLEDIKLNGLEALERPQYEDWIPTQLSTILKRAFSALPETLCSYFCGLAQFETSFSPEAALAVLLPEGDPPVSLADLKTELLPLQKHCLLSYSKEKNRYSINPMVAWLARQFAAHEVPNAMTLYQRRLCCYFMNTLLEVSQGLSKDSLEEEMYSYLDTEAVNIGTACSHVNKLELSDPKRLQIAKFLSTAAMAQYLMWYVQLSFIMIQRLVNPCFEAASHQGDHFLIIKLHALYAYCLGAAPYLEDGSVTVEEGVLHADKAINIAEMHCSGELLMISSCYLVRAFLAEEDERAHHAEMALRCLGQLDYLTDFSSLANFKITITILVLNILAFHMAGRFELAAMKAKQLMQACMKLFHADPSFSQRKYDLNRDTLNNTLRNFAYDVLRYLLALFDDHPKILDSDDWDWSLLETVESVWRATGIIYEDMTCHSLSHNASKSSPLKTNRLGALMQASAMHELLGLDTITALLFSQATGKVISILSHCRLWASDSLWTMFTNAGIVRRVLKSPNPQRMWLVELAKQEEEKHRPFFEEFGLARHQRLLLLCKKEYVESTLPDYMRPFIDVSQLADPSWPICRVASLPITCRSYRRFQVTLQMNYSMERVRTERNIKIKVYAIFAAAAVASSVAEAEQRFSGDYWLFLLNCLRCAPGHSIMQAKATGPSEHQTGQITQNTIGQDTDNKPITIVLTCCAQCFAPQRIRTSTNRCAKCCMAYYCGKDCQKKHWPVHVNYCKALQLVHEVHMGIESLWKGRTMM